MSLLSTRSLPTRRTGGLLREFRRIRSSFEISISGLSALPVSNRQAPGTIGYVQVFAIVIFLPADTGYVNTSL